jgi:hypothetical protein
MKVISPALGPWQYVMRLQAIGVPLVPYPTCLAPIPIPIKHYLADLCPVLGHIPFLGMVNLCLPWHARILSRPIYRNHIYPHRPGGSRQGRGQGRGRKGAPLSPCPYIEVKFLPPKPHKYLSRIPSYPAASKPP